MSNLRPTGIPANFDGVDRYFLFNFRRIDELQYRHPGINIFDQVKVAKDDTLAGFMQLIDIVDVLCDGQVPVVEIPRSLRKNLTTGAGSLTEVRIAINRALIESMPEPTDQDDVDPHEEGTGIFDIPKFIMIAMSKFGMSEAEAWEMTPRKFSLLDDAYLSINGLKKKEEASMSLLDLP